MDTKKRIVIFNVNWLGDCLFSTAAIRNIRYNYPESFIACIIPGRCSPILEGNPHLDEVILFDEKSTHKGLGAKLKFIQTIRSRHFDTVFLFHRSFTRLFMMWLAGIPERIGYPIKKRGFLLTKKIVAPPIESMHRRDYYLYIVEKAGLQVKDRFTEFLVSNKDERVVEEFLQARGIAACDFLVGINPGGNWPPKRWEKEYFSKLSDRVIKEFRAKVILTGGAQDAELAQEIQGQMQGKIISTCGVLSLKQLGALCRRLDVFITADSGPLHIAAAVGARKIIALFGPTHPSLTGPNPTDNVVILRKDIGCKIPCYDTNCKDNRCMKAITPEDVMAQIKLFRK